MKWLQKMFGASSIAPLSQVFLHNTLTAQKEEFVPLRARHVKMYNCGPTVYGIQHIGNLSMFVFADTLRRMLEWNGYVVKQVINITDVGHLVSDGDDGEDKMTKGLKREKKALTLENMRSLAEKYTDIFLSDLKTLNINTEHTLFPRASDHIPAQIAMIKTLEEKGYAYLGKDGVYFDTTQFPDYGKLGNINLEGLKEGARVQKVSDKRNPTDFVLWKFDTKIGWESPWGMGFPGWHIECSAMIRALLGSQIDIHTGGIEHIPVHHNNEIAQTEATTGKKPFARYWLHRAHLQLTGAKISKSDGNTVYLSDIIKKGYHPLAFRYLLLGSHYRQTANFTWDALGAAQTAFLKLRKIVDEYPKSGVDFPTPYGDQFKDRINDDLDTAGAVSIVWQMINDENVSPANVRYGLLEADKIFGLNLREDDDLARTLYRKELGEVVALTEVPQHIQELLVEREAARAEKRWDTADEKRKEIEAAGYVIEDTAHGPRVVAKY